MSNIGPDHLVTPPRQTRSPDEIYARNQENMRALRRGEGQQKSFAPISPSNLCASILAAELSNSRPVTARAAARSHLYESVRPQHFANLELVATSMSIKAQVRPIGVDIPLEQRANVRVSLLPADANIPKVDLRQVMVLVDQPPHAPLSINEVEAQKTDDGWAVRLSDAQWSALVEAATLPST